MFDIATDIFRALITGAIFFYLRAMRGKESPRLRKAWIFLIIGFGLLFLGGLLNIADNFPSLGKYIVIGRTRYADFLEQVIGYVFGLLFLGIGFWRWIPAIIALRVEEIALRKSQEEFMRQVAKLTAERNKLKTIIECELAMPHRKPPPLPSRKRGRAVRRTGENPHLPSENLYRIKRTAFPFFLVFRIFCTDANIFATLIYYERHV